MSGMMTNDPLSVLKTLEASRIKPETRMQCKVCGFVYDPAEGCEEWQASRNSLCRDSGQLRLPRLRLSSPLFHRSRR